MRVRSEMSSDLLHNQLRWDCATGMYDRQKEPQGVLVPNTAFTSEKVAVVYNRGDTPPRITVTAISDDVQTVLADGIAVAVVARACGPLISPEDVLLVERHI
jgi:hypothetical protein